MQANHEIIVAVYASFNRRDIPAVLARMHPQVDWPNAMEDTRVHGHAEVQELDPPVGCGRSSRRTYTY